MRAGLAKKPWLYRRSSANAHVKGEDDALVKTAPLLNIVDDWRGFLSSTMPEDEAEELRVHERTGRPLGSESFIKKIEKIAGRILVKQKAGRKKKEAK